MSHWGHIIHVLYDKEDDAYYMQDVNGKKYEVALSEDKAVMLDDEAFPFYLENKIVKELPEDDKNKFPKNEGKLFVFLFYYFLCVCLFDEFSFWRVVFFYSTHFKNGFLQTTTKTFTSPPKKKQMTIFFFFFFGGGGVNFLFLKRV